MHVTVQGTAPPSYRRAPVECTECTLAGKDCDVFEGYVLSSKHIPESNRSHTSGKPQIRSLEYSQTTDHLLKLGVSRDGHGRCRFCSHHRACHNDIHSVCAECRALGKHCQHFAGSGARCDGCGHTKALHGIETAIGGRREPVQCTEVQRLFILQLYTICTLRR